MNHSVKIPLWFFVVGLVATAWNGIGVVAFISDVMQTPEQIALLPEAHQTLRNERPIWATAAFAMAVFGGLLGSLCLLSRQKLCSVLYAVSLIGLVGQNIHHFLIAKVQNLMPEVTYTLPFLVFVIAILTLFFSLYCAKKGWLK